VSSDKHETAFKLLTKCRPMSVGLFLNVFIGSGKTGSHHENK